MGADSLTKFLACCRDISQEQMMNLQLLGSLQKVLEMQSKRQGVKVVFHIFIYIYVFHLWSSQIFHLWISHFTFEVLRQERILGQILYFYV